MKIFQKQLKRELRRLVTLLLIPILMIWELPKFFGAVTAIIFVIFLGFGYWSDYPWYQVILCGLAGVTACAVGLIILEESMLAPLGLLSFIFRMLIITLIVIVGHFRPKANDWLEVFEEV